MNGSVWLIEIQLEKIKERRQEEGEWEKLD
jgi:hypothetical protein